MTLKPVAEHKIWVLKFNEKGKENSIKVRRNLKLLLNYCDRILINLTIYITKQIPLGGNLLTENSQRSIFASK